MKSRLSIVQIIALIFSVLFTWSNGMFIWKCHTMFRTRIILEEDITLFELATNQLGGVSLFLLWLFYILVGLMLIYLGINLFNDHSFLQKKIIIILPAVSLILYMVLLVICDNYCSVFNWQGENLVASVGIEYKAFVKPIALAIVIGVEAYKQFKCPQSVEASTTSNDANTDELKKFKDLLDSGVITQEEFDAKKEQILGL